MGPVQQAFHECHALQCGFCTPGFVTTVTAYLRDHPDPTREEAREAICGNLCRCTGYVNIVDAVQRGRRADAATGRGRRRVTTRMFGERVPRVEDAAAGHRRRPVPRRPRPRRAGGGVRPQPARARAGASTSTSAGALEVEGLVAIYTYEDLDGRDRCEPLPLLIPHPTLTHGRTPYALARDEVNHVGEAVVMVVAEQPVRRRGRRATGSGSTTSRCRPSSASRRPGPPSTWCTTTCPATSRR